MMRDAFGFLAWVAVLTVTGSRANNHAEPVGLTYPSDKSTDKLFEDLTYLSNRKAIRPVKRLRMQSIRCNILLENI